MIDGAGIGRGSCRMAIADPPAPEEAGRQASGPRAGDADAPAGAGHGAARRPASGRRRPRAEVENGKVREGERGPARRGAPSACTAPSGGRSRRRGPSGPPIPDPAPHAWASAARLGSEAGRSRMRRSRLGSRPDQRRNDAAPGPYVLHPATVRPASHPRPRPRPRPRRHSFIRTLVSCGRSERCRTCGLQGHRRGDRCGMP